LRKQRPSAVADACEQLNQRLKEYKEKLPEASFREVVNAAYFDRLDALLAFCLSALIDSRGLA